MTRSTSSPSRPSSTEAASALASLLAAFPTTLPASSTAPTLPASIPQSLLDLLSTFGPLPPPDHQSHTMELLSLPSLALAPHLLPAALTHPSLNSPLASPTRQSTTTYNPLPTRSGRVPQAEGREEDRGMLLFNEYLSYDWPSDDEDDPDFKLPSEIFVGDEEQGGRGEYAWGSTPASAGDERDSDGEEEEVEEDVDELESDSTADGNPWAQGKEKASVVPEDIIVASTSALPPLTPPAPASPNPPPSPPTLPTKAPTTHKRKAAKKPTPAPTAPPRTSKRRRANAPPSPPSSPTTAKPPKKEKLFLTKEEKLERRKMSNREHAAASRKRALDQVETDRQRLVFLEGENVELLKRVAELERELEEQGEEVEEESEGSEGSWSGDDEDDGSRIGDVTSPSDLGGTPPPHHSTTKPLTGLTIDDLSRLFQWAANKTGGN